jgi:carbon storage regulator CsrA
MLVLSRKVGERIHVGDNIVLEIRRIAGNRVTLALDAPRTVRILRGELEQAAREFEPAENTVEAHPEPSPAMVAPASVTIFHNLPAETVGRHCVS